MDRNNVILNVSPENAVIVERKLFGKTSIDKSIEALPIPYKPLWLWIIIKMIRFYQNNISQKLGNRCVFDPSCSHYSELAFRKKGFIKGVIATVKRLHRCRPENGGADPLQ